MKKPFALLLTAIMAFSITACDNKNSEPDSQTQAGIQTTTAGTSVEPTAEKLKSEDYPLPEYNKGQVYDEQYLAIQPATDGPIPYEEYLGLFEPSSIGYFYKIQITKVYTYEEGEQLSGWEEFYGDNTCTFYDGIIVYDYFNKKDMNQIVTFRARGQSGFQDLGHPPYQIGDTVASVFTIQQDDQEFLRPMGLTFDLYSINSEEIGYLRAYPYKELEHYDLGLLDFEKEFITTCTYNPVRYYHKFIMSDIAEFLKDDLINRGLLNNDVLVFENETDDSSEPAETSVGTSISSEEAINTSMGQSNTDE